MSTTTCVYCLTALDPTQGEGDHVVPAALGEFEHDLRFRHICRACNQKIGKSEQVLLHCGPEAFFRRVVNPALPPSRQRGRSPVKAAMGAPGVSHTVDLGDHRICVRSSAHNPRLVFMVDQLVIHDSKGNEHHIPLFSGMRSDALRRKTQDVIAPPPIPRMWLHCDLRRGEEYEALIRSTWSGGELHQRPTTPIGDTMADGTVHFKVNTHYWQSIAKIAFHYLICRSRRGIRGDEPGFAAVRCFIMNGGDRSRFFRKPDRVFALPFGEGPADGIATPTQWCHILAADETSKEVVGYVQLFAGPGCIPTAHHVVLGSLDSDVVGLDSFVQAHVYQYYDRQTQVGNAGTVKALAVSLQSHQLTMSLQFISDSGAD